MRVFAALTVAIALLGLPAALPAQSITVPATVTVEEPGLVVIRATAIDADDCRWYSIGPGMQTFPPDVVAPKHGVYLGFALRSGVYKVGVICAKDVNGKAVLGQPQVVVVTVGKPEPPPDPKPEPADPLTKAFAVAYAAEADPAKATLAKDLSALYHAVASAVQTDASLKTNGSTLTLLKNAIANHATLKGGKLAGLKTVAAKELNALQLIDADVLTPGNRQAIAGVLTKCADAIGGLK